MKQQSLEEIKALAQGYAAVPVVREILADTATPIGLVSLVRKESSRYFLLESLEQNDQAGIPSSGSIPLPGSGPRTGTPRWNLPAAGSRWIPGSPWKPFGPS